MTWPRMIFALAMWALGMALIIIGIIRTGAPGEPNAGSPWYLSSGMGLIVPGLAFAIGGGLLVVFLAFQRLQPPENPSEPQP